MDVLKFGELEARVVGTHGPVVVLLHGFGAPGTDLVSLARVLGPNRRYVFPEAPLTLPPMFGPGRAWWMLDLEKLQLAMLTGVPRDLSVEHPEGLVRAREQMLGLLEAVEAHFGVLRSDIVLGGFSQGAMLSCDVALHTDEALRGLVLLSGSFVAGDWWRPRMNRLTGQNVFQSHGTQDTVLAISGAEALRDGLEGGGAQVQWHSFRGGHEIPMDVIEALRGYLPPGEPQSGQ